MSHVQLAHSMLKQSAVGNLHGISFKLLTSQARLPGIWAQGSGLAQAPGFSKRGVSKLGVDVDTPRIRSMRELLLWEAEQHSGFARPKQFGSAKTLEDHSYQGLREELAEHGEEIETRVHLAGRH